MSKYKHLLQLNQIAESKLPKDLDLKDLAFINVIVSAMESHKNKPFLRTKTVEETTHYLISYKLINQQLTCISRSKKPQTRQSIYSRIDYLCEAKVFNKHLSKDSMIYLSKGDYYNLFVMDSFKTFKDSSYCLFCTYVFERRKYHFGSSGHNLVISSYCFIAPSY